VRVIGGELGGRRLVAPRGRSTRPTSDRVREAVFSALGDLTGARVIDLYAGSGALAIEALSRGAEVAVAVEHAPAALRALRLNAVALGLEERLPVVAQRVERAAPMVARHAPFDLLLVDPPYADVASLADVLPAYLALATPEGRLVLEHASRDEPPALPPFVLERTRRYGDTSVSRYRAGREGMVVQG
jgi:16S rRNA (guanine966-N2)-methyltransferase